MADELTDFANRFPVGATFEAFNSSSRKYVRDATTYLLLDKNVNLRGVTDVHGGVFRCDGYQYVCWSESPDDEPERWTDMGISRAYPPTLVDCGRRSRSVSLLAERYPAGQRVYSHYLAIGIAQSSGYGRVCAVDTYAERNRAHVESMGGARAAAPTVMHGNRHNEGELLIPVVWDHGLGSAGSSYPHNLTPVYE